MQPSKTFSHPISSCIDRASWVCLVMGKIRVKGSCWKSWERCVVIMSWMSGDMRDDIIQWPRCSIYLPTKCILCYWLSIAIHVEHLQVRSIGDHTSVSHSFHLSNHVPTLHMPSMCFKTQCLCEIFSHFIAWVHASQLMSWLCAWFILSCFSQWMASFFI